jgi:hypothetical protein
MSCLSFGAFSQIAKIIEIRNEVMVKEHASSRWRKAQVDMYLEREAEIKTGAASACMLAFDEQLKNILTIDENSQIRLENLQPSVLFLPRGRVFSLIEDVAKIQEFRVRTPVAIAGVRGTGDSVASTKNGTTIKCFEGKVYAQLFDYQGNGLIERMVFEGLGVSIDVNGQLGDMFFLDERDYDGWNGFRDELTNSRAERGTLPRSFYERKSDEKVMPFKKEKPSLADALAPESQEKTDLDSAGDEKQFPDDNFDMLDADTSFDKDSFGDIDQLKGEHRDDLRDNTFEQFRKDTEDNSDTGVGGQGTTPGP